MKERSALLDLRSPTKCVMFMLHNCVTSYLYLNFSRGCCPTSCSTAILKFSIFVQSQGAAMPKVFWEYVLSPTRSGVLTALDFLHRSGSASTGASGAAAASSSVFDKLSAAQRETLRHFIATAEPVKLLTGEYGARGGTVEETF